MAERHTRAVGEVMGKLSTRSKDELCDKIGVVMLERANEAIRNLRAGDIISGWNAVNEARSLSEFDTYCTRARRAT